MDIHAGRRLFAGSAAPHRWIPAGRDACRRSASLPLLAASDAGHLRVDRQRDRARGRGAGMILRKRESEKKTYLIDGLEGLVAPGWPRDRQPEPPMRLSSSAKARGAYTSCVHCPWLATRCCETCPKAEPARHVFVAAQ